MRLHRRAAVVAVAAMCAGGMAFVVGDAVTATATASVPAAVFSAPAVTLHAGAAAAVPVTLRVAPVPHHVDLEVLLDVSTSMRNWLPGIERQLVHATNRLTVDGIDVHVGLAAAGTAPSHDYNGPYSEDGQDADPPLDPLDSSYHPPVLFQRVLPVGPAAAFDIVAATVRAERLYPAVDSDVATTHALYLRDQAQLLGLDQLVTGAGYLGSTGDAFENAVPAGAVAGWRSAANVDRVLVDVTDQPFDNADGTPRDANGNPDVAKVASELAKAHVRHVGLVVGDYSPAVQQLSRISTATGTFVPSGGLRCGGLTGTAVIPAGAPLVCNTNETALAVESAVLSIAHPVTVGIGAVSHDPAFHGLTGPLVRRVNPWVHNTLAGIAHVSCPVSATESTHRIHLVASYAGQPAAAGLLTVHCAAAPAVPAVPIAPIAAAAAAAPAIAVPPGAPPAPAPAPGGQPANATQADQQRQLAAQVAPGEQSQEQLAYADRVGDDPNQTLAASRLPEDHNARYLLFAGCVAMTAAAAGVVHRRRTSTVVCTETVRRG